MITRAVTLALIGVLALAAPAGARTVFGFLPPKGAGEAPELQKDIISRLERTRRYALLEVSFPDATTACTEDARLEKVVQLSLSRAEKFSAEATIRDCASGEPDAVQVRASSGRLASLAGALRQDFIDAYPLLVELEIEGGALLADVGPTEKVEPGSLLYSYAREGGSFTLQRRVRVAQYDEGNFRSRLEELFRMPGTGAPQPGEQLSPRALFAGGVQAIARPRAAAAASQRIAGADELVGGAIFSPPLPEAPLGATHALRESTQAAGRSFSSWVTLAKGALLEFKWDGDLRQRIVLKESTLRFFVTDVKGRESELGIFALAGPIKPGTPTRVLVSWLGPWTEVYVGGRFVGGSEDLTAAQRGFALGARGDVRVSEPELFELVIR